STVDIRQKTLQRARASLKAYADTPSSNLPPYTIAKLQADKISPTNDVFKYTGAPIQATVQAIWNGEKFVDEASTGPCAIILNQTNFYAEMGGQVGDGGLLTSVSKGEAKCEFQIDT